jgi:dolichyl-phosphate beta-glucosyltransferase
MTEPMGGGRRVSVVVPAFNEERRLPPTLERLRAYFRRSADESEILVVDDGSRDGTAAVVARAAADWPALRLIRHERNTGKGYAVRAGVLAARGDAVLVCDADLSTPIEELDRLWTWFERGYDVVAGSRRLPDSTVEVPQPLHRRVMGRTFNGLVSLFCLRGFRDTQCGFKLFRASVARRLFGALRTVGFAFDVEVLVRARRLGARMVEVPVVWNDADGSRIRALRDSCRMALEILSIGVRT